MSSLLPEDAPSASVDLGSPSPRGFEAASPDDTVSRPRGKLIAIVLLGIALLGTAGALAFFMVQLSDANTRIEQQQKELDEQHDLIDTRETFGAAMAGLLTSVSELDGVLTASVVPFDSYQALANRAWSQRWSLTGLERAVEGVTQAQVDLKNLVSAAQTQAATNETGSTYEAVIDRLGGGYVTSLIDDADGLCGADVLACVTSEDPLFVHFDAADSTLPYMSDWLRTGLAYHEFAHVLQMTNPEPTDTALEAFGGDMEFMADCFALTYLDGWTLDHRVWVSDFEYWDVSIGYGAACNATQAQAVRDWYAALGFHSQPIT